MKIILTLLAILYGLQTFAQKDLPRGLDRNDNKKISTEIFHLELAYRWAPVHYQDTDNSNARADYITNFNFDNNWTGTDNWDHLNNFNESAYAYYSVVETATHWFIVYAFYHPRDWADASFDQEHENDLEGILCVIQKGVAPYGTFQAMVTVSHNDFYSFTPAGGAIVGNHESIDGKVSFQLYDGAQHPMICQEPKGHPIKAFPSGNFTGKSNEDGIIYFPSKTITEVPSSGNDRSVSYKLVNFMAAGNIWAQQLIQSPATFAKWGTFNGDEGGGCGNGATVTCSTDAARTPWGWDDGDDGPNYAGTLALDPAALVNYYFKGFGSFNLNYTNNKYISDLKQKGFTDANLPSGWPGQLKLSELYQKVQ
jgi:hypothetical protein